MNVERFLRARALPLAGVAAAFALLADARSAHAGWTHIVPTNGQANEQAMLLTDGSVLAQDGAQTKSWSRLTPDSSGSYVNGKWSAVQSSTTGRLYGPSWVLKNGSVWVAGGEYINGGSDMPTDGDHNTIETFDPTANPNADGTPGVGAWTVGPDSLFTTQIGDTGAMLSDGRILLSSYLGSQTLLL